MMQKAMRWLLSSDDHHGTSGSSRGAIGNSGAIRVNGSLVAATGAAALSGESDADYAARLAALLHVDDVDDPPSPPGVRSRHHQSASSRSAAPPPVVPPRRYRQALAEAMPLGRPQRCSLQGPTRLGSLRGTSQQCPRHRPYPAPSPHQRCGLQGLTRLISPRGTTQPYPRHRPYPLLSPLQLQSPLQRSPVHLRIHTSWGGWLSG